MQRIKTFIGGPYHSATEEVNLWLEANPSCVVQQMQAGFVRRMENDCNLREIVSVYNPSIILLYSKEENKDGSDPGVTK